MDGPHPHATIQQPMQYEGGIKKYERRNRSERQETHLFRKAKKWQYFEDAGNY